MRAEGTKDHGHDSVEITHDVIIPKMKHSIFLAFEEFRSSGLGFGGGIMLPPVNLDNQPGGMANEVGDISSERNLASKFFTVVSRRR